MTPTNITEAQFIFSGVTGVDNGQNAKKPTGKRKIKAAILIAKPYLPSVHLRAGSFVPYKRRHTMQLIVMKYEMRSDTPPSELMALRATEDPKLMQERRHVTTKETRTARTGRFHPGVTCGNQQLHQKVSGNLTLASQDEAGRPPSRAKDHT